MPKATTPTAARQGRRHNPLEEDVVATGILRTKPGKRKSKDQDAREGDEEHYVDAKASRNILRIGRELADEDESARNIAKKQQQPAPDTFGYDSRFDDEDEGGYQVYGDDDEAWGDDDEVVEEIEVDPNDLETYRKFMRDEEADELLKHGWDRKPSGEGEEEGETVNLADLILEKIAAHEAGQTRQAAAVPDDDYELPPKVIDVYTK
jgi:essential nuclear protein 1